MISKGFRNDSYFANILLQMLTKKLSFIGTFLYILFVCFGGNLLQFTILSI